MKTIESHHAEKMMQTMDVPKELSHSAQQVALVFTQSWCPQWSAMKLWLQRLGTSREDLKVHFLEYDKSPHFQEFMNFKESHWKNDLVPYVRYYREGEFLGDSNFCSQEAFEERLKG